MSPLEGPIAVLGDESLAAEIRSHISDRLTRYGEAALEEEPSIIVAVGAPALATALSSGLSVPFVPVDIPEYTGVSRGEVPGLVEQAVAGEATVRSHRVFEVSTGDVLIPALFDVTLMTAEPARISEYRIAAGPDHQSITTVRSDGVVIASSLGSAGYAHRVGGPIVHETVDAAAVVPVAPFSVERPAYVVSLPVSVTIERDEGAVALYVDGRRLERVTRDQPVTVSDRGTAPVVEPEEKT